jgi:hypothetical protein
MKKAKAVKKPNRQDLTLRNLRALKAKIAALDRRVQALERASHYHVDGEWHA